MAGNSAALETYRQNMAALREEAARRMALAAEPCADEDARRPRLNRLLGELSYLAEPLARPFRTIDIAPAAIPKRVMILPGFAARPSRMRYLANQLERAGHRVKRWGLGMNWGTDRDKFAKLEKRLENVFEKKREPVYLIGWSLGGLYARELAKRHPDKIAKVITMGSPFSHSPRSNNVWRIYQAITGQRVDKPPIDIDDMAGKPPVETVALWSPRDGAIHPRSACGKAGERDRAIAMRCTHMGFCFDKHVIETLAAELDGPHPESTMN